MAITNDYQDAILEAQAEAMDMVREVVREFVMPAVQKQARQMWATMPDEMKERFKMERPKEYAMFMKEK